MTDTSELVKQLLRESRHHTDVKAEAAKAIKRLEREFADFNRLALKHRRELEQQLADENTAQAIERLERERERLEENRTQLIKNCDDWSAKWQAAEQQLADARAEIERMDRVFERIAEANVLDMDTLHPDGIQQEARQARREAFERACKAQCKKCRTTGLSTYDSRLREWGHHGYDFVRCDAVFIRALMDEESTSNEPSE